MNPNKEVTMYEINTPFIPYPKSRTTNTNKSLNIDSAEFTKVIVLNLSKTLNKASEVELAVAKRRLKEKITIKLNPSKDFTKSWLP